MNKPLTHFTHPDITNPRHAVTVTVSGAGGTGSQVLQQLARIHVSLIALGHPGFFVRLYDDDRISEANVGRQLYSPADIGRYKSHVIIERLNRFYGLAWEGYNTTKDEPGNIIISCVDTVEARKKIYNGRNNNGREYEQVKYWMDFGNSKDTGQVILGTMGQHKHISSDIYRSQQYMKNFLDMYPKAKETPNIPSCSLADALESQDLFINSMLAQIGCHMLWKMIRELRIAYNALFLNLRTMEISQGLYPKRS